MQLKIALLIPRRKGFALLMAIVITGAALLLATGIFQYASTTTTLNHRHVERQRAVAAAEAATEKVLSRLTTDYRDLGEGYILGHLDSYRSLVPTSAEFPDCADFSFQNLAGDADRIEVSYAAAGRFEVSSGKYSGLRGNKSKLRIVANAKARYSDANPVGSVYQDIELLRVPIFQFAIFYNVDLEIDNLPVMTITGPVHCNTNVYLNPVNTLTFKGDLTTAGNIYLTPMPGNPLADASGPIVYQGTHLSGASTLNLPIGTNTSPDAVHAIIEVPSSLEDPYSSIGQQRYYNKADLIILIQDTNIVATSGLRNSFATIIPGSQITNFVSTNATFYNKRELKTVKSTDIDVARFAQWTATNSYLGSQVPTIYVADQRTQSSTTQPGIRLVNGQTLPSSGLTVATPNPLYIKGHYNAPAGSLGTTNTSATMPASVVADAVTLLSTSWVDTNATSSSGLSSRVASDTTVNAAMLTGLVRTTSASHSGGAENFPRFLEEWTGRTSTINGSMVAMFYSKTATNLWRGIGSSIGIYNPPNRNWSLDQNFLVEGKLPPATPSVTILVRGNWRMPAPYTTNVLAGF